MIIRALLPKLTPKTVKEKIIVILSTDFPLTIKELKARIKKNFNKSVSYQSVHKELNRLVTESIIVQENKKYLLNTEWIREVGLFSDLILSNYTNQKKHSINKLLELKNDGDSLSFEFDSYVEFDRYFLELMEHFNEFFDKDKKILMHYTHNWWPLIYPVKEKEVISKMESEVYCFCRSDSFLDKYCMEFERKIGMNIMYTTDESLHWNVMVVGDLIFTFHSDRGQHNAVGDFFKSYNSFEGMDLKKLVDILTQQGRFRVIVLKDSKFAKTALQEIKLFKNAF